MVEVPSVAINSDKFAKHVDFFSIGTNDLTQYTLAADRMNDKLKNLYSHFDPGVLRLIKLTIDNANKENIEVSLCGEMASNPRYVMLLLGMGIRSLSITTSMILEVKKIIRSVTISACEQIAAHVLEMESEEEITAYLIEKTKDVFPLSPKD